MHKELLEPVNVNNGWYYVDKRSVEVYFGIPSDGRTVKLPSKQLYRLLTLALKEKPK